MVKHYTNFNIKKIHRGSIILIGNFDGLHLGHQKLFKLAQSYKKKYSLKIGVVNFDPMPKMFFNKKEIKNNNFLTKVCALLIHAAKIDENYTDKEEEIIKKTLIELGIENENVSKIIEEAKIIEESSNQILDFTREVKGLPEQDKIKIIEALWSIIYSNKDADIYETNLMRRLAGLLYIDNKTMGDIKEKIKKNLE